MSISRQALTAGTAERRWREAIRRDVWLVSEAAGRSPASKYALVWRTYQPCATVASVAHEAHVSQHALARWQGLVHQGAIAALAVDGDLVAASQLAAANAEIKQLKGTLWRMSLRELIAKEASTDLPVRKARMRHRTSGEIRLSEQEIFPRE